MKEEWKVYEDTRSDNPHNIRGSLWEVSNYGNVKKNGELYECGINKKYKQFGSGVWLHRAVAELFIPNPENKPCVDHINGNSLDNRAVNLRWVTVKENCNNPITIKRNREAQIIANNRDEVRKKHSESNKGKSLGPKGKHKVWDNKELNIYHFE